MTRTLTIALLYAAFATGATPIFAEAQGLSLSICRDRDHLVQKLERQFGESLKGLWLEARNGVVELYVSESGSWTLLMTNPDGKSCPIAAGDAWEDDDRHLTNIDPAA